MTEVVAASGYLSVSAGGDFVLGKEMKLRENRVCGVAGAAAAGATGVAAGAGRRWRLGTIWLQNL